MEAATWELGSITYQYPMQDNLVARELFFFFLKKRFMLNQYVDAN
jgi:hypothetical protein